MTTRNLQIEHLNRKMEELESLRKFQIPPKGWIKMIRQTLGMSMRQLGNKLNISRQGVLDLEDREKSGSVTISALKEVGKALNMTLVYGFVPNDVSLNALIEKQALHLARRIVTDTANSMTLEDQAVSDKRLEKAIIERAEQIRREMPKILWDQD